jgi:hypothetical protein
MEAPLVRSIPAHRSRGHALRVHLVSLMGPATVAAGAVWGILQPDRLTFLHPRGQSFWWLFAEAPLFVVVVGVLFTVCVARPLLEDLEARDAAAR